MFHLSKLIVKYNIDLKMQDVLKFSVFSSVHTTLLKYKMISKIVIKKIQYFVIILYPIDISAVCFRHYGKLYLLDRFEFKHEQNLITVSKNGSIQKWSKVTRNYSFCLFT